MLSLNSLHLAGCSLKHCREPNWRPNWHPSPCCGCPLMLVGCALHHLPLRLCALPHLQLLCPLADAAALTDASILCDLPCRWAAHWSKCRHSCARCRSCSCWTCRRTMRCWKRELPRWEGPDWSGCSRAAAWTFRTSSCCVTNSGRPLLYWCPISCIGRCLAAHFPSCWRRRPADQLQCFGS